MNHIPSQEAIKAMEKNKARTAIAEGWVCASMKEMTFEWELHMINEDMKGEFSRQRHMQSP